jgi:hypothetical protein
MRRGSSRAAHVASMQCEDRVILLNSSSWVISNACKKPGVRMLSPMLMHHRKKSDAEYTFGNSRILSIVMYWHEVLPGEGNIPPLA